MNKSKQILVFFVLVLPRVVLVLSRVVLILRRVVLMLSRVVSCSCTNTKEIIIVSRFMSVFVELTKTKSTVL